MMSLEWAEALYQTLKLYGGVTPDIDDPENLKSLFNTAQDLLDSSLISAMHDISDGGLVTSLIEMSLCSGIGLDIRMDISSKEKLIPSLFAEEAGLVVEVQNENLAKVKEMLKNSNLSYADVARTTDEQAVNIFHFNETVFSDTLHNLFNAWSDVSYKVQRLRDNIETAESERKTNQEFEKFLTPDIKFDIPPAQKNYLGKSQR